MGDIYEYLKWRGDLTFDQDPFNEVDNIILSQLVYVDFDGIVFDVSNHRKIDLLSVYYLFNQKFTQSDLENANYVAKNANQVFEAIVKTKRFKTLKLSHYVNEVSYKSESQFSAIQFDIDENQTYIAFSGTDATYAGWKENFNMLFLKETPSQEKATQYLAHVIEHCNNIIYVGGHSKGGNLSIVSVMNSTPPIQDKIQIIYNNDGVGVDYEDVEKEAYLRIYPKIKTFIPQFSWVGYLFEHKEVLNVVESSKQGILQHDLTTWKVNQNQLVRNDELDKKTFAIRKGNDFLRQLPNEESKVLVDQFFNVLNDAAINENGKFKKMNFQDFIKILSGLDKLSTEHKKILFEYLKVVFESWKK